MSTDLRCPACARDIALPLQFELLLSPTGGDADYVDTRETHHCPSCRARLEVSVRTGLGDHPSTVRGVRELAPPPHRRSPHDLALSPDGHTVALATIDGPFLLGSDDRVIALPPVSPDPTRLDGECPRLAWSRDGRLLLEDGRIYSVDGELVDRIHWRHSGLLTFGWLGDEVAAAWRDLESHTDATGPYRRTTREWVSGIDTYGRNPGSYSWPTDSGFVMSGIVRVSGRDLLRLAPPFHGSAQWSVERWTIDGGALVRETTARLAETVLSVDHTRSQLVAICGEHTPDGQRCSVAYFDRYSLALLRELPLPGGLPRGQTSVHIVDDSRIVVRSDDRLVLARLEGNHWQVERTERVGGLRRITSRNGAVVVTTEQELLRWWPVSQHLAFTELAWE